MYRCVYEGNLEKPCPMGENLRNLIIRSCDDNKYGRNCATIYGQLLVTNTLRAETGESGWDESLGLITAQMRLIKTPFGEPPEHIRQAVGKATFPLREKRPEMADKVFVHHVDLYCTLLNLEQLEAANWYQSYASECNKAEPRFEWWCFNADEGEISQLVQPKSSVYQYDDSFHKGSAALGNFLYPPLLVMQEYYRRQGT